MQAVFDATTIYTGGKGHVAFFHGRIKLSEKACQQRIIAVVEDDEARIDRDFAIPGRLPASAHVHQGVVQPQIQSRHEFSTAQRAAPQPGNAGTDNCGPAGARVFVQRVKRHGNALNCFSDVYGVRCHADQKPVKKIP